MKVALVYPMPFGEEGSFGGGERYAAELASSLANLVSTTLVTIGRERRTTQKGPLRIEMHPWIALARGLRQNPLAIGFLKSLWPADVIHCISYSTLLTDFSVMFARLTGKKVFITDVGGGGDVTLTRILNVSAFADGLLLLSEFAGLSFRGHRPHRHTVYGGVDTVRFRPGTKCRRTVLYVGRLLPHKGIHRLIEAVDPSTPLRIVGRPYHDPYFQHLVQLAKGKTVTFVTNANDEDLVDAYQSSAVLVLPSDYRDLYGNESAAPELLSLTLLEAMACETPVICTNVGGMAEIVSHDETGFIVAPDDREGLRRHIAMLAGDPQRVERMGRSARHSVLQRFTWDAVAARCLAAYQGAA